MTISPSELAIYRAQRNDDTSNNGGRSTLTTIASGVRNGLFSDLQSGASLGGNTEIRKVFIKQNLNAVDAASAFNNLFVYLTDIGDDDAFIDIAHGTPTDTQGSVGFGAITAGRVTAVNTGSNTITLSTLTKPSSAQTVALVRYRPSNQTMIVVTGATLTPGSGNTATITNVQASDFQIGDVITERVYFESGVTGEANDLMPRIEDVTLTTSAGTFTATGVTFAPRAAVSDEVTITFVTSQVYNISIPALGITNQTGNIATDLTLNHPDAVSPGTGDRVLFIPAAAWGGTWAANDRVTFDIISGTLPLWIRRQIGANPTISGQQNVNFALDYQTS